MTTSFRDAERLSAYLDGQLHPSEAVRLESRLPLDPELGAVMKELRQARAALQRLPTRRAPRDFTLKPGMAGLKAPLPRAYPFLRLASVMAMMVFLATFLVNTLGSRSLGMAAYKAAPACEQCGGGGPTVPQAAATPITEAPLIPPFAAMSLPTPTPPPLEPTTELAPDLTPESERAPLSTVQREVPVPPIWQALLGGAALLSSAALWWVRASTERRFRKQWNKK